MADAKWVEASLTVSAEQAEAVAEVLGRYLSNGVVVEQDTLPNTRDEINRLEPVARVFGYLLNDSSLHQKQSQLEEALWHLSQIQSLPTLKYKPIQDEDWMASWKKHYRPMKIGKKLVIIPAWIDKEFPGRIPIRINPGMAFGTGTHPSTRLCLQLLEQTVRSAQNVIDIGCGSGILSIAALKLGAKYVLAVDNDPPAIQATQENRENNQIYENLEIGLGSVSEIRSGQFSIRSAPIVVVNILASIIIKLLNEGLTDLMDAGGQLILAVILDTQVQDVLTASNQYGLVLQRIHAYRDWAGLLLEKNFSPVKEETSE